MRLLRNNCLVIRCCFHANSLCETEALKGLLLGSANLHAFVTWKPFHWRVGMEYFYPQEADRIHFCIVNTKYCDHQNDYNPHYANIKVA